MRVRLTLWYVSLLAVLLLAGNAFLYLSLSRTLWGELDRLLAVQAQQVVATLDVSEPLPPLNPAASRLAAGVVVALYNRTGERLIASDARSPLPAVAEAMASAVPGSGTLRTVRLAGGQRWRVLTLPVVQDGRAAAVLQVARSEEDVEATLRHLLYLMALAVPLTLVLAVGGGLALAGRALSPIDRITRTAGQIEAQDLSRRLGPTERDDEVGRLAATFDGMLDRLELAFRRQRQFTADASHELRTPLALLTSQIDLALERPRPAEEYRAVLRSVREDAGRLGQLLGELLTLARADAGQEPLEREPLRLDHLAQTVAGAMAPLARARGVALRIAASPPAVVAGDQTRLAQLVVNLVDNGLKYTPAGGAVSVAVDRDGPWAVLRVADTGVGIAAEHVPRLFERFYRVDRGRARAAGGTGLGLAICHWIVAAHQGEIAVQSEPGRGSTFAVRLPATGTPSPAPPSPAPPSPAVSGQPPASAPAGAG
jgi:heavy metal sensor kinase